MGQPCLRNKSPKARSERKSLFLFPLSISCCGKGRELSSTPATCCHIRASQHANLKTRYNPSRLSQDGFSWSQPQRSNSHSRTQLGSTALPPASDTEFRCCSRFESQLCNLHSPTLQGWFPCFGGGVCSQRNLRRNIRQRQ